MPRRYSTANRQAQTSATKQRILEAVEELVLESGPEKLTINGVSDRSGVALATIYKHYGSRAELLAAAHGTLAAEVEQFAERLTAAGLGSGAPPRRLRKLVEHVFDDLSVHGGRLARIPAIVGVPAIDNAQSRATEQRRLLLFALLGPAAEAGKLRLPLDEAVALALLATSPGLCGDLLGGHGLDREQAVELVWELLNVNLFGAGPSSGRRRAQAGSRPQAARA